MFKIKKESNAIKEEILFQKKNKRKIIKYLTEGFLLNPKAKYTKEKILLELKIKNSTFIEEYFKYLLNKKYIRFNKNYFSITFAGYEYLEKEEDKSKSYENNLISISISMIAMIISAIGTFIENNNFKAILIIALVFIMDKFSKNILDKKYY